MSLETFLSKTTRVAKNNSPSILAALAVGGIATTGLMSYSAGRRYQHELDLYDEELPPKQRFQIGWRGALPLFIVGGLAATCVIAGTAINNRRNAALAGLVTLGEVTFREYKEKAEEVLTKQKREQVDKELGQKKLDALPANGDIVVIGEGDILLFDTLSARLFKSSQLAIEKAEVELNRRLLHEMYVSLNEWYDEIGLPRTDLGDDLGWHHAVPLEISFIPLLKENKPVMGIQYRFRPETGYDRIN